MIQIPSKNGWALLRNGKGSLTLNCGSAARLPKVKNHVMDKGFCRIDKGLSAIDVLQQQALLNLPAWSEG